MQEKTLEWESRQAGSGKKTSSWYWTIGIVGGGIAVASFISNNFLLGLLAIIGAFTIMLAGSSPRAKQKCAISESGVHIDSSLIPFKNILQFAINEDEEPKKLSLRTKSLMGIISVRLDGVDFRAVRSELKNYNVEEVDKLDSVSEGIAEWIGM